MEKPIYLDNNATTPCDDRVLAAMLPYFTDFFGNAASKTHAFGWQAEEAVDIARENVAQLIGAEPKEIIFTSGATESDNLAMKGVFESYAGRGNHIITVCTEHKAVLDSCQHLEKNGARVTYLPVSTDGLVDLGMLESSITDKTILISVMYANNEIGVLQPIGQISKIARRHGILLFSDGAQAAGKVPVNVASDGIDLMSLSGHKMYGPKGVGALFVRRKGPRVRITGQMDGGGHEKGLRSGTLNVPGIVGLGVACSLANTEMKAEMFRLGSFRDRLERGLMELGHCSVNGSSTHRLPHVTNLSFDGVDANALMIACSKHLALSSGSACSSASIEPSYVLKALGISDQLAHASLRFALGRFTSAADIDRAIDIMRSAVGKLRGDNPAWEAMADGVDGSSSG